MRSTVATASHYPAVTEPKSPGRSCHLYLLDTTSSTVATASDNPAGPDPTVAAALTSSSSSRSLCLQSLSNPDCHLSTSNTTRLTVATTVRDKAGFARLRSLSLPRSPARPSAIYDELDCPLRHPRCRWSGSLTDALAAFVAGSTPSSIHSRYDTLHRPFPHPERLAPSPRELSWFLSLYPTDTPSPSDSRRLDLAIYPRQIRHAQPSFPPLQSLPHSSIHPIEPPLLRSNSDRSRLASRSRFQLRRFGPRCIGVFGTGPPSLGFAFHFRFGRGAGLAQRVGFCVVLERLRGSPGLARLLSVLSRSGGLWGAGSA
ncbi:hypothetical protein BJ546DRAFT_214074 [Cryomyces antarcticus]